MAEDGSDLSEENGEEKRVDNQRERTSGNKSINKLLERI